MIRVPVYVFSVNRGIGSCEVRFRTRFENVAQDRSELVESVVVATNIAEAIVEVARQVREAFSEELEVPLYEIFVDIRYTGNN